MANRYDGNWGRARQAAYARKGPHWAAHQATKNVKLTFELQERVRIKRNKQEAVIEAVETYGYKLRGVKGIFFATDLEKL